MTFKKVRDIMLTVHNLRILQYNNLRCDWKTSSSASYMGNSSSLLGSTDGNHLCYAQGWKE